MKRPQRKGQDLFGGGLSWYRDHAKNPSSEGVVAVVHLNHFCMGIREIGERSTMEGQPHETNRNTFVTSFFIFFLLRRTGITAVRATRAWFTIITVPRICAAELFRYASRWKRRDRKSSSGGLGDPSRAPVVSLTLYVQHAV